MPVDYKIVNETLKECIHPHAFNDDFSFVGIIMDGTTLSALGVLIADNTYERRKVGGHCVGSWAGCKITMAPDSDRLYEESSFYKDVSADVLAFLLLNNMVPDKKIERAANGANGHGVLGPITYHYNPDHDAEQNASAKQYAESISACRLLWLKAHDDLSIRERSQGRGECILHESAARKPCDDCKGKKERKCSGVR